MLSDKLFYWLFQSRPDRILSLLDGLFLPPPERPELPALILEAQMGPAPATGAQHPRLAGGGDHPFAAAQVRRQRAGGRIPGLPGAVGGATARALAGRRSQTSTDPGATGAARG